MYYHIREGIYFYYPPKTRGYIRNTPRLGLSSDCTDLSGGNWTVALCSLDAVGLIARYGKQVRQTTGWSQELGKHLLGSASYIG